MNTLTTEEQLRYKINRLEACIADFKEYDARRKELIKELTGRITYWKQQCDNARHQLDILYETSVDAPASIKDPNTKAVFFAMMEKAARFEREANQLRDKINQYEKSGHDVTLKTRNEELTRKNKGYRQQIQGLQDYIKALQTKIAILSDNDKTQNNPL